MTKWLNDFYCFFIRWPCKSTTSSTIITSTAIHTLLSIHSILTYTDTCTQQHIMMYADNTQCAAYIDELSSYSLSVIPYRRSAPSSWSALPCDTHRWWCSRSSLAVCPRWFVLVNSAGTMLQYLAKYNVWQICPIVCFWHTAVCVCIYICICVCVDLLRISVCMCVCVCVTL